VIYKQSQVAAKYLRGLFGEKVFDNPKDHEVLARLIGYCTEPDNGDIVIDFFAGSGSVGDAVIRLNRADGGDRRFILVQLPEPTGRSDYPTISSLLLERLRRACAAMVQEEQATVFDNSDLGVRTLKLGSSNFRLWNPEGASTSEGELAEQLTVFAESVLDGATDEDLLFEILLKSGVELSTEIERVDDAAVYVADAGRFAVCLEQPITEELVDAIAARRPDRVVFLDRGFESDAAKANAAITLHKAGVEVRVV
jgi:adenine-specific DNA-methyltransferase